MRHRMTRESCLAKADECQRDADRAQDERSRGLYERLADHWRKMAQVAADQTPSPYPSSSRHKDSFRSR